MKAFLSSLVLMLVISVAAAIMLGAIDLSSSSVFSQGGARL